MAKANMTARTLEFEIGSIVQVEAGWEGTVTGFKDGIHEVEAKDGTVEQFRGETLALVEVPKKTRKHKIADKPCQCGCGELVTGRYKQGHDSRHKSSLLKAARGDDAEMAAHATAELVKLGWDRFIVTETDRRKRAKAAETTTAV